MKRKIDSYWILPIIVISGIFGFYTSSYSFFIFKPEIDLLNLLTLITTSTIGVYIASTLQKNIYASQFEKGLIIDSLKSLRKEIKSIDRCLLNNSLGFSETIKTFKEIGNIISEINDYNTCSNTINPVEIKKLKSQYFTLKSLITGGNRTNNTLSITQQNQRRAISNIKIINKHIINLMIKINRK